MKPLPWSFSRLNAFTSCPRSFSEISVYKRVKDEQGEAAKWGERAHKHLENHINGAELHADMLPYAAQVQRCFVEIGGVEITETVQVAAEFQAALSKGIVPIDWFAKDVWVRGILDVLRVEGDTAWVVDWKMGKVKPDSRQLKLFALLVFYHFPQVQIVRTRFEWLQFYQTTRGMFARTEIPRLWQDFLADLNAYVQAFKGEVWRARPSGLCKKHCAVTSCPHNGRNL